MTDETTSTTEATGTAGTAAASTTNSGSSTAGISQDEVNKLIGKTRVEAREAARKQFLADLGIEDLDTVKTILTSAKAKEDAEKTETQKLAERLTAAEKRAQDAEAKVSEVETARRIDKRDRLIEKAAADAKADAPADVIVWAAANQPEALAGTLTADGTVDEAKVKALVDACKTARPKWFGTAGPGAPSNAGGRGVDPNKARREGVQKTVRNLARKAF